jgi:mannose/fructose/N-acetylgalactosamine-specific phosphotransferase system component IIB
LRYLHCKEILIVDDQLWRDDFMQNVLRLSAPSGVRVQITPVHQAIQRLESLSPHRCPTDAKSRNLLGEEATLRLPGAAENNGLCVMVLVRSPQTALALLENGFPLSELNVGGLGAGEGATRLHRSVSANSQQIAALRAMRDQGVRVYFQAVPEERPVEMAKLMPARQPQHGIPSVR